MKYKIILQAIIFIFITGELKSQDTFSIVALDSITGEVGSAGASCVDMNNFPGYPDDFLGELFPGIGAINTQAWYNQTNQINARNRMNLGETPEQIIQWLTANDVNNQPELRQYGIVAIVNGSPESAAHTGSSTDDYKNHITGPDYSIQGNILSGQQVLDSMEERFLNAEGDLACKLMAALQGANMVGADSRCTSNGTSSLFAFVKVAQPDDLFGNPSFLLSVRTSAGEGIEPIDSLQIIFDDNKICSTAGIDDIIQSGTNPYIYPNPAGNHFTVEIKDIGTFRLEIINITGNLIFRSSFRNKTEIDASSFSKGIYLIKISNGSISYFTKLILK